MHITGRMRIIMTIMRALVLMLFYFIVGVAIDEDDYTPGVVARRVVNLKRDSFKQAIEDPANPLWFLKFYAPWYVGDQYLLYA